MPEPNRSTSDCHPLATPAPLRLAVDSDPARLAEVRRAVESFAAAAGLDEAGAGELGLLVNEAMANVIRHAYGGQHDKPIEVGVDCDGRCVRVTLRDWGNGVNPLARPRARPDPATPGGLGLICLRELADSVAYTPQPDGVLLTMTKGRKKC